MKKLTALLCAALCLLLCACGGGDPDSSAQPQARAFEDADVTALLSADIFSEELESVETDLVCALYGLDADLVTHCVAYLSTGASAEEVVLFTVSDADGALEAVRAACEKRVADQTEGYADYLPGEVTKLEDAILEVRQSTVLLVVANDPAAARAAIDGMD